MKFKEPPRLATRILLSMSCHPDNEALLGDLCERYQDRQSAVWYWRQTFIAIINSFVRETWGHRLHSILALVVGWSAMGMIWLGLETITVSQFAWNRHACTFFWLIAGSGSGFAVGLLTPHRKRPMILLHAASVGLFLMVFHRPPRTNAILYWIDTITLTISILLAAVPHASSAHSPSASSAEELT